MVQATRPTGDDAAGGERLEFDAVSMTYPDGTEALAESTLMVEPGEFVCLIGPSGCGKSTVLKLASGLLRQTAGTIRVPSRPGYVFQEATLLPWRTVEGNVELPAELQGLPTAERRRRSAAAIAMVGLTGFELHLPRQLSGGMQMRVSLARALTLRPRALLFDEPFGALDEVTRERLNEELQRLYVGARFTALFVTHSVPEAVFLSTRVLVMSSRPGRIVDHVDVPFPYPRQPDLRYSPEFTQVAARVSKALRAGDD